MDISRLAINQICTKPWSLERSARAYAVAGAKGIGVWRDKVAEFGGVEAAKLLLDELGLQVTDLCVGGLLTTGGWSPMDAGEPPVDAGLEHAVEHNKRVIDEAAILKAHAVCFVAGGLPSGSKDIAAGWATLRAGLSELVPYAHSRGVVLGLEPLHPAIAANWSLVTSMRQANDLCDEFGEGLGIIVDVNHVWFDPDLEREIMRAGDRLVGYHVCDWLRDTGDLFLDRGLPGDGIADIPAITRWMYDAGYKGLCEMEVLSTALWERDQDQLLLDIVDRHITSV